MSSVSSISHTQSYPSPAAHNASASGQATTSTAQIAAPSASDSVSLSDTAQFHALMQRSGLKVEGGTLGQLFSPAFFAGADANNDARLSSSEFSALIEQNGGNASQASRLYREMGGGDQGLSYDQFRQGVGQGDAKDFFNNLVMTRIKGSGSGPDDWLKQLAQLGAESDAASSKLANELKR